jgi:hypothetical protein
VVSIWPDELRPFELRYHFQPVLDETGGRHLLLVKREQIAPDLVDWSPRHERKLAENGFEYRRYAELLAEARLLKAPTCDVDALLTPVLIALGGVLEGWIAAPDDHAADLTAEESVDCRRETHWVSARRGSSCSVGIRSRPRGPMRKARSSPRFTPR